MSWNGSPKEASVKKCMKTKMRDMRGICWKRARMSSGKKSAARNQNFNLKELAHELLVSVENNSRTVPRH